MKGFIQVTKWIDPAGEIYLERLGNWQSNEIWLKSLQKDIKRKFKSKRCLISKNSKGEKALFRERMK